MHASCRATGTKPCQGACFGSAEAYRGGRAEACTITWLGAMVLHKALDVPTAVYMKQFVCPKRRQTRPH